MWSEVTGRRALCGKTFKQGGIYVYENRLKTRLHYGTGFENEVDFTPRRVNAGGFDGWTIDQSPWTYGIGARNGLGDGWNGAAIGGHRLWYRLVQFGWLHWPTRAWEQIGGAPTYNREYLTATPQELVLGPGGGVSSLYAQAVASWDHLWTTPNDGNVSIEWVLEGRRAKEEIVLDQNARQWIANNAMPSNGAWANDDTYLTVLFRLDGTGNFDWNGNLDDADDRDGRFELRDAEDLLFYMPLDYVWSSGDEREKVRLYKRIFTNQNGTWLAVGAKLSELAQLPAGDLRFDPTLELQPNPADGVDSDIISNSPDGNNGSNSNSYIGEYSEVKSRLCIAFDLSSIQDNAEIMSSTMSLYIFNNNFASQSHVFDVYDLLQDWVEAEVTWNDYRSGVAWDSPGALGAGDIGDLIGDSGDPVASSYIGWVDFDVNADFVTRQSIENHGALVKSRVESDDIFSFNTSDESASDVRPKLTVEYTEASDDGMSVPVMARAVRRL